MSSTTSSYIDFNNEGLRLLGDEENYEDAARMFRKAFEMLQVALADDAASIIHVGDKSASDRIVHMNLEGDFHLPHSSSDFPCASRSSCSKDGAKPSRAVALVKDPNKRKSTNVTTTTSSSSKRQRRNDHPSLVEKRGMATKMTTTRNQSRMIQDTAREEEPLGRPLFIETGTTTCGRALIVVGASILYNYGYALQRIGNRMLKEKKSRRSTKNHNNEDDDDRAATIVYNQAIASYGKAVRLSGNGRSCMVQWLCCHNMQQLLRMEIRSTRKNKKEARSAMINRYHILEALKINVLRSISHDNLSSDDIFLSVLRMLHLGGTNNSKILAAAA